MKIRILDDSIRLRLDREEVERIGAGERVDCATRFPSSESFSYGLEVSGEQTSAAFTGQGIVVNVPEAAAKAWAFDESDVSIRGEVLLDEGRLRILVEKDFECLEPREGESQSNRFANPKSTDVTLA